MPPKTTFADFERVIHSPPMMADPLFEMMMADTVAEELDAKWSDSDSEEAVLAAEYAVGRVFSDYDPGPCTPRQSRGRRPPLNPGFQWHLYGWIERIPGGTRQNDGLESGIKGAAAATLAWNGAALKQPAACSVLLVSLERGREAHPHARPLECGSARLSLFAVLFFGAQATRLRTRTARSCC